MTHRQRIEAAFAGLHDGVGIADAVVEGEALHGGELHVRLVLFHQRVELAMDGHAAIGLADDGHADRLFLDEGVERH